MPAKFSPLLRAGWEVIPLSADGKKTPLVSGYHGRGHKVADTDTVKGWAKKYPDANPAIVLPHGVIGFDLDGSEHGDGVDGLAALAEFERLYGPLPESGHIFHGYRDGVPSPFGTRLYRVPDSMLDVYTPGRVVGNLTKVTGIRGVDVITPWIRYNVAPGAVHASGEVYEYDGPNGLPRPEELPVLTPEHVEGLLKKARLPAKRLVPAPPVAKAETVEELLDQTRKLVALGENETMLIRGEQRGWQKGDGFFALACQIIRLGGTKEAFLEAAEGYWDAERQWGNAEGSVEEELDGEMPYSVSVGTEPYVFAREVLDRHYRNADGVVMLRYHSPEQMFWYWDEDFGHYVGLRDDEARTLVERVLAGAMETGPDGEIRPVKHKPKNVSDVIEGLKTATLASKYGAGLLLEARNGIPFRNGWLDMKTGELVPLTPERDVRWVVQADYDLTARCPEWMRFLRSIGMGKGTEEYRLLRQWFGYLLSGSTEHQKALVMIGPKRAGKGVTQHVAEALFGGVEAPWAGAASTMLERFDPTRTFGLANLIGKGLATMGDARWGRNDAGRNALLLSWIGGDAVTVEKKNKDPFSIRPTARLMIASNESPRFFDASDALSSRFLMLEYHQTFYGKEDLDLEARLCAELPGIARWALGGYLDLQEQGHFTETTAGISLREQVARDSSPVRVFVEEECVLDPKAWETVEDLAIAYSKFSGETYDARLRQDLGRNLKAAFPDLIKDYRPEIRGERVTAKRGLRLR